MPDQKISVDPAAADLSGCIIPVVTGGINKQAANSLFGITGVANGVIYSAGNRNTSDPTNFNYVPGTQTLTVVGPIRTSPVTNEATVATPANGMIIYSTALSKFRAYENGAWVNLIGGSGGAGWALTGVSTLTGVATITSNAANQHIFNGTWSAAAAADAHITFGGTLTAASALGVTGYIFNPTLNALGTSSVQVAVDINPTFAGGTTPVNIGLRVKTGGVIIGNFSAFQGAESLLVQTDANSNTQVVIRNTTSGTLGQASIRISGSGTILDIASTSGGFTPAGIKLPTTSYISAANALNIGTSSSASFGLYTNNLERARFFSTGELSIGSTSVGAKVYINQAGLSSGWIQTLRIDPGPHTSITAATEFKDYNFNTRTATWLAGTTATQRFAHFQGQTVAGASASATFTDLYTVYIDPSVQGSQAIITNNWALGLGGGLKLFAGTTTRPALVLPTGTNLTTSQAGVMENDGTHLWFTFANSGARWQLDNQVGTFGWALAGNTLVADGIIGDVGTGGFKISLYTNNTARQVIDSKGTFSFTQDAQSASHTFITFTQAGHTGGQPLGYWFKTNAQTGLTAPSNAGFFFNIANSFSTQYTTGNFALWASAQTQVGTISFVGASTITNAINFSVTYAPQASTNASITNSHGLYVWPTNVGAGVTNSYGITANAMTGATNNYAAQFLGGQVNFAAGTTTYAPIVIPSGTNMTTPTAGVVENNGTNLFFTPVSTRLAVSMNASAATPATTGTMTTTLTNLSAITITPTGACTFNASGGISGQRCAFVITTSGASSFVLTWGTNFKTTGTLATGTVTAKVFTVEFVYDSVNWNEVARTVAM